MTDYSIGLRRGTDWVCWNNRNLSLTVTKFCLSSSPRPDFWRKILWDLFWKLASIKQSKPCSQNFKPRSVLNLTSKNCHHDDTVVEDNHVMELKRRFSHDVVVQCSRLPPSCEFRFEGLALKFQPFSWVQTSRASSNLRCQYKITEMEIQNSY